MALCPPEGLPRVRGRTPKLLLVLALGSIRTPTFSGRAKTMYEYPLSLKPIYSIVKAHLGDKSFQSLSGA